METPLKANVECTDGARGRSVCVLINPTSEQVTHLVVEENAGLHTDYVVPVESVGTVIAGTIQLHCSRAELEKMDPFVRTRFVAQPTRVQDYPVGGGMQSGMGPYYYLPYVTRHVTGQVPVEELQIPVGELAVQRGTRVEATDGYVGHVDEFVVNPKNGHITHLVMREGHLWGHVRGRILWQ